MRKKVLLISSWTNSPYVLGYYLSPPMGLYRMRHWLKGKHDVTILDPNLDEPLGFLKKHERFDIYGFCPTKDNLHNDIALIRFVQKMFPESTIILGGVEATYNYHLFFNMKLADYIILGEGEKALEYFLDGKHEMHLPPSTLARNYSYSTVLTPEELSKAANIDFSELRIPEYWKRNESVSENSLSRNCVNLYITNYCPQGCKFCSTTRFVREACPSGAKVNTIEPRALIEIIKKGMRQLPETKTIYFHDDNACHDKERTMEWCRLAIKENLGVTFVATSRINHYDDERLAIMKEAGFRKLSCGIEAYSDSLLKKIRKGQTTKTIDEFLKRTRMMDMPIHANMILCQPEAEVDDIKRSAEFCLRILGDKRNTITLEYYIKAYAGSWYYDNWDLIEYTHNTIPSIEGTKGGQVRIPVRFLPKNEKVREIMYKIDEAHRTDEFFIEARKGNFLTSNLTREICELALNEL